MASSGSHLSGVNYFFYGNDTSERIGSGRLQLNKVSGDPAGHLLTRRSVGLNVGAIPTIAAGSSWNSYRYAP